MATLNPVDLLLLAFVLWGAWRGWGQGLLAGGAQLLILLASVFLAFWAYRWPAEWVAAVTPSWRVWTAPISFLLIFLATDLVLGHLAHGLLRRIPPRVHGNVANRALGVLPGLGNGLIRAAVATVLLLSVPMFDRLTALTRDSALASRLATPVEWVEGQLLPIFEPAVHRTLQALTVPVGSRTRVQLPFRVAEPRPRPDLEARMLQMVNEARAQEGLKPLRADAELTEVARRHGRDMFARGYFSHYTPEGGDLNDRLRAARVRYLTAGENLALAQNLRTAHQGLMDSPGHRANLLRPQFGRLGIGVLDGGRHGLMITQNFRN